MQGNSIPFNNDDSSSSIKKSGMEKNRSVGNAQNIYVQKLLQNKLNELQEQKNAMRNEAGPNDSKRIAQSFIDKKIEDINRLLKFQNVRNPNENINKT